MLHILKELRNCILCIIPEWSLFCSVQVCILYLLFGKYIYYFGFYALVLSGHYFIQHGFIQICIFYLFFWKPFFCLSALFVITAYSEFDVLFSKNVAT